ncbi:hypothetical protein FOCC_FOCC015061 [Frankliniella occidentalis]|uniref:Uncharacterized protein LOC113204730 n=1 Tax=Frankliniella occidentalis TaxID=133901 RepID=A0A6J1S3L4_FRAOC|nr:uncharacterized protein LOC113204730 [Frankliniella occidentalis]KAE8739439.1 hypothetical protein FOCC_FOCC015061 [Frankliniella occidentalis]
MYRTMLTLVVLAALCSPGQAFLQDLLPHFNLQPQQYSQHQYPQYQYSPQYQYRRAAYEPQPQPQPQPVQYGYAYSHARPAVYQQWLPSSRPAYEAGTAYSYASNANPISTFLQGSWLPWSSNRQPVVQQQQPQQLSAQLVSSQPQVQPQQPAIWGFLPWGGSGSGAQQGGNSNPVLSWLQHPLQLPWGQQQQQQQQAVYTTPLAPSHAAPAVSTLHVVTAEAPVGSAAAPAHLPSSSAIIKPEGVVLEEAQYQQVPSISNNAIRRVALEHVEHADGQPCA